MAFDTLEYARRLKGAGFSDQQAEVLKFVEDLAVVKPRPEQAPKSFLQVARSLRLQGPADWSSRLDDYLYGGATLDEQ